MPTAEPKPGYLTSEFWGTLLVHALAVVTTILDLTNVHWSKGLSGVQAAVPLVAMAISAALQNAYHDKRAALKIDHAAHTASTFIAELDTAYNEFAPVATEVLEVVDPELGAKVTKVTKRVKNAAKGDAAP